MPGAFLLQYSAAMWQQRRDFSQGSPDSSRRALSSQRFGYAQTNDNSLCSFSSSCNC